MKRFISVTLVAFCGSWSLLASATHPPGDAVKAPGDAVKANSGVPPAADVKAAPNDGQTPAPRAEGETASASKDTDATSVQSDSTQSDANEGGGVAVGGAAAEKVAAASPLKWPYLRELLTVTRGGTADAKAYSRAVSANVKGPQHQTLESAETLDELFAETGARAEKLLERLSSRSEGVRREIEASKEMADCEDMAKSILHDRAQTLSYLQNPDSEHHRLALVLVRGGNVEEWKRLLKLEDGLRAINKRIDRLRIQRGDDTPPLPRRAPAGLPRVRPY